VLLHTSTCMFSLSIQSCCCNQLLDPTCNTTCSAAHKRGHDRHAPTYILDLKLHKAVNHPFSLGRGCDWLHVANVSDALSTRRRMTIVRPRTAAALPEVASWPLAISRSMMDRVRAAEPEPSLTAGTFGPARRTQRVRIGCTQMSKLGWSSTTRAALHAVRHAETAPRHGTPGNLYRLSESVDFVSKSDLAPSPFVTAFECNYAGRCNRNNSTR
jgi:hypothetical protein